VKNGDFDTQRHPNWAQAKNGAFDTQRRPNRAQAKNCDFDTQRNQDRPWHLTAGGEGEKLRI
jgi:hypothetical protein